MDLKTVVTISTLLLITAADQTSLGQNVTDSVPTSTPPSPTSLLPSASTAGPSSNPSRLVAALGLLTITWYRTCEGDVNLNLYHPSISSLPVCHGSGTNFQSLLRNVCKNQKGCTDTPPLLKGRGKQKGYNITASGAEEQPDCDTLRVQCTDVDVVQGQLQAYKVVTALLCCFLLLLILIRFTRPTVKALQKRFSERRQNRWVGPTQSHSALERLAVSDSREPSSNRNSDYNF
ncbi:uncharacterized protein LOC120565544 isoform X2 [Perca fluviatilis]|uniref:uncharacterized protein LOC120565544 isoform X2 n=1 Tax=Perca fluviatilis TaxID=8168 RepID=UPI001964C5E3|nr:uncharacterized protein LOC120565544 isoform X2 [Perca fluviatilis]